VLLGDQQRVKQLMLELVEIRMALATAEVPDKPDDCLLTLPVDGVGLDCAELLSAEL